MPKWLTGEVQQIQNINHDVRIIFTKAIWEEQISFIPGQFVVMDLPIGEKRLDRWRSYSIANTANDKNIFEFCIVRVPNGPATRYLFEETGIGTQIKMKYPAGNFTVIHDLDKELVLLCTGTGVAPFRSMLAHIRENRLKFHKIHLIFGTRYEKDILYRDEFEAYANEHKNFTYSIALSRENFNGYQGYVHNLYLDLYDRPIENRQFYICGWQNMIDEAANNLINKLGYNMNQVKYELYG